MNNSAGARGIASFTFIVALLFGARGRARPPDRPAARAAEAAWARVLGAATVMLGALSSFGGVLYLLASY